MDEMKNGQVEAQDFTTGELIEALRARNFDVLTAPVHAEITRAQREATRAECAAETETKLATARAEAALAEREACARDVVEGIPSYNTGGDASTRAFVDTFVARELERRRDRIRARTTPATLSTETLAAIAEARGLRVVEPELLAGLEPPVLRWDIDEHSTARVGPWSLEASALGWSVYVESPLTGRELIADECTDRVERSVNRRAAEAALRSLGVAFRVEGGGAK